uniref:Resolvase HTH domain-containing protein n=1 Tax=Amphimedon queenslandica TaxID=400682 RepID=A0A1X7VS42_AMPQE
MANEWDMYFSSVSQFLIDSERQFGVCNERYTHYVLEQLDYIEETVTALMRALSRAWLHQLCFQLSQLLTCVRSLKSQWEDYSDNIVRFIGIGCHSIHTGVAGRPRFDVRKEELEYLKSLSFSLSEIAALVGISRSTLYRRTLELDLADDPTTVISDDDLRFYNRHADCYTGC